MSDPVIRLNPALANPRASPHPIPIVEKGQIMYTRNPAPVTVTAALSLMALLSSPVVAQERYPGQHWEQLSSPEAVGWSSAKLERAREYSNSIGSAAVMIIYDGRILDQWGDTSRRFKTHSIRKSLLSALYGIHVHEGHIDLDATLEELGIDDKEPLSPTEKQATIRHLLQSRSGIYLPALFDAGMLDLPARGSHAPGTFYYYNGWDFNALGTIFEQLTQKKIFEEFKSRIADPLGMEDFRVEDGRYNFGSHDDFQYTRFFAYPFRISARDLARFGLMFLRQGRWRGEQIIPAEWIRETTTPYSELGERTRFGYAAWRTYLEGYELLDGSALAGDVYYTLGLSVHRLYVVPWLDLVVVHRANTDLPHDYPFQRMSSPGQSISRLFAMIIDAKITNVDAKISDLDAKITDAGESLIEAARDGERVEVRALLEGGAYVDARDPRGRTALHYAAGLGHMSVVRALLDASAPFDVQDARGETPLMWASLTAQSSVVHALLEAGADVNVSGTWYGETALMWAALSGDTAIARALLASGADVGASSTSGRTALMLAEALGHTHTARLLASSSARDAEPDAMLPPEAYLPPWIGRAARSGELRDLRGAQALLSRGATIPATGETALLWAAARGDTATVQRLLQAGAALEAKAKYGWTPLLLAAANGHVSILRSLLDAGADIHAAEQQIGQPALIWAAQMGHTGAIQVLLDAGAPIDARDRFGGTALTRAADGGRTASIEALIRAGANINAHEEDGDTPLLEAVWSGHIDAMRVLLNAGAEVNATDNNGRTPLMIASMYDRDVMVRELIAAGADINRRDNFGSTALDQARTFGLTEVVTLLEEARDALPEAEQRRE